MPKRPPSRPVRWAEAAGRAREAYDNLEAAFSDLQDLQGEYGEWQGSLPENLATSALAEKLSAIEGLDFDLDTVGETVGEVAEMDLPRGFGRD